MDLSIVSISNVLTRTSGYLKSVTSHSVQPYRGCTFGKSLCGVGCYVRNSLHITRGRPWGGFLEVRENAAESYLRHVSGERNWARRSRGKFSIFLSSATEPFLPQEFHYHVTRSLFEAMLQEPPDLLVVQTHSHRAVEYLPLLEEIDARCELRLHFSIETDRESLAGLPRSASSVEKRMATAGIFKSAGIRTVVTVSPLLPIAEPEKFFEQIADIADAVVIDHFIEGDGTPDGSRTRRTELPAAVGQIEPDALELAYRDRMVAIARRHLPGRVGISIDGFAGRGIDFPSRKTL